MAAQSFRQVYSDSKAELAAIQLGIACIPELPLGFAVVLIRASCPRIEGIYPIVSD
jgi:hypothetical protein